MHHYRAVLLFHDLKSYRLHRYHPRAGRRLVGCERQAGLIGRRAAHYQR